MSEPDPTAVAKPPNRDFTHWLRSPLYWLGGLAFAFSVAGWYSQSHWANNDVDRLLRDTTVEALGEIPVYGPDGTGRPLSDYRGKWVVLDFWASWCPYCVISLPGYAELQRDHPERLTVLAINTHEPPTDGAAFLRDENIDLPMMRSSELVEQLGIDVLPSTVLLDPEGRQAWASVGYVPMVTRVLLEQQIKP